MLPPPRQLVTTLLCLLPELVSVDSLYFRTCLLTCTHAHTQATGTCSALCSSSCLCELALRTICSVGASARLRLLKVCRELFPSPIAIQRSTCSRPRTHRAPRPFWCPIMQAHLELFTVPDWVGTTLSAACVLYLLLPMFFRKCIAPWECLCVHVSPRGRAHLSEVGVKV